MQSGLPDPGSNRIKGMKKRYYYLAGMLAVCWLFCATGVHAFTPTDAKVNDKGINIRSGAGTDSPVIASAAPGSSLHVSDAVTGQDGRIWYVVSVGGNTKGYIRGDLITLGGQIAETDADGGKMKKEDAAGVSNADSTALASAGNTQTEKTGQGAVNGGSQYQSGSGKVKGSGVRIRSLNSTASAVVAVAADGQELVLLSKSTGADAKTWYQVSCVQAGGEVVGYIRSDLVKIVKDVTDADSRKESRSEAAGTQMGAVKGSNVNVRMKPVSGTVIARLSTGHSVEVVSTQRADDQKDWCYIRFVYGGVAQEGYIRSDFVFLQEAASLVQEETNGSFAAQITGINVRIRKSAVNGTVICQKSNGFGLTVEGKMTGSDGKTWYQVKFSHQGQAQTGYVRSDFVVQADETADVTDTAFESELNEQGFPESYRIYLRALHEKHPKWKFQAVITNLKWENAVAAESIVGKNFVPKNSIASFKSLEKTAYSGKKDKWYTFDGGSWVAASRDVVAYYMDPRNFLTESGIYQFETLEYREYQTVEGVSAMLAPTFMRGDFTEPDGVAASYAETFAAIGRQVQINPYHLAARCSQEQGNGKSGSISGSVKGYENLFNYLNVGAYAANGNTPVVQGLIYASRTSAKYQRPWNTRYSSILGGAMYLKDKFIDKKQNTLYFQKFNVVNTKNGIYSHQYMTNLSAAATEAGLMKKAYGDGDQEMEFVIPVYSDMPQSTCQKPSSDLNPNNYLASLKVGKRKLVPEFDGDVTEYAVTVASNVSKVTISALPVAKTSSVSQTGKVKLKKGINTISVVCRSASGNSRTYTLTITRE